MEGQNKTRPAGGFATQRGINYQNRVGAYFSTTCLAESIAIPGLPRSPVQSIRCETGEPLADLLLTFENDGIAFIEVKRTIQLTSARMKPVLSQVIQQYLVSDQGTSGGKFPWRRNLDPIKDRLMLLTSSESPVNVTKHLAACLARIGPEVGTKALRAIPQNDEETRAFDGFHKLMLEAWKELMGVEPSLEKVLRVYSLLRIGSLDVNPDESDEQQSQALLAHSVLSKPEEGPKAWFSLVHVMGTASETRQTMSRRDLRQALLDSGFDLVSSPSYVTDIRALREYTRLTLDSLDHLATLTVHGRPVRIQRAVTQFLRAQAMHESLVVVGDPGAGKSGVLHELARCLLADQQDVVFLAADRMEESLRTELGLQHELADVLDNWSSTGPGLLIIDALDAARGSKALIVLQDLIRRVVGATGSGWTVVASIRVFDLRYSQELQSIFRRPFGESEPEYYQDRSSFFQLRHIKVPRFSTLELENIRTQAPELNPVFDSATPSLRELLEIPFNLRLVAEMLSTNLTNSELIGVETQVGLLSQYWLHRVIKSPSEGTARELVLVDVLRALVSQRRLTISKLQLRNAAATKEFSSLCSDNVLVEQIANLHGRYIVGFSHHLLFDYAASRLLLAADFDHFLDALASERDLSLFLRPSIDLFFKEAWLRSRDDFWSDLTLFSSRDAVPAIAKIIGPAVIPELAKEEGELAPLITALGSADPTVKRIAEQWVIHVVGAVLAGVPTCGLELWSKFCLELTQANPSVQIAAVCQSLIDHILESAQNGVPNTSAGRHSLNRAAVYLLDRFASGQRREGWIVGRCISNVMDLFRADPEGSAIALRKLITPEEIQQHGAQQGHWIARKIPQLFDVDPRLAADIYTAFFGYNERSEETTSMGGSRILAMTSNRRQDYHQAHWQLAQHFSRFVEEHFELCKPIVIAAAENVIESEHGSRSAENVISYVMDGRKRTVSVDYSAIWDSSGVRGEALNIADLYFRKLEGLTKSASTRELAQHTVEEFLRDAQFAYFLRKVLIVAKNTGPALAAIVYPLFSSATALWSFDLSSLIGDALQTNYVGLDEAARKNIELAILGLIEREEGDRLEAMAHVRDKLLGCIPAGLLVLPESLSRVEAMSADGGPPGNPPPYRSHGGVRQYSEADRLRESGVPIDAEPNASFREKGNRLWEFASKFTNGTPKESDVLDIEADIYEVQRILLGPTDDVHRDVLNSVEAQLLAACATVAKLKSLDCSSPLGMTIRKILFSGLDSPEPEYHPEHDAQWDKSISGWGTPVQRIEAAEGIGNLISHGSCVDEALLAQVRRGLKDLVPSVRFQIAIRLLPLYDKDIDALWSILTALVRDEPRAGVLSGVLYSVVHPLAGRYKVEVVELIRELFSRTDLVNNGGDAFEWGHRIATGLYIWQNDSAAFALVRPRLEGESFRPVYAGQCLRDIREAMSFSSDVPQESDSAVRKRAFGVIEMIVASIIVRMNHLIHEINVEDRDESWQEGFQELGRLVDYISNQIYFSSGAYDGTNSQKKLDDNSRRIFWRESQQAIRLLSDVAIPSAAHHLIETLQSFISFQPVDVFHAIAAVVRSAKSWGYQYESLAVDLLVKVTESYIAEYRMELQNDRQGREELIDILETFVEAGWPSARRLSYRLEEIFR